VLIDHPAPCPSPRGSTSGEQGKELQGPNELLFNEFHFALTSAFFGEIIIAGFDGRGKKKQPPEKAPEAASDISVPLLVPPLEVERSIGEAQPINIYRAPGVRIVPELDVDFPHLSIKVIVGNVLVPIGEADIPCIGIA